MIGARRLNGHFLFSEVLGLRFAKSLIKYFKVRVSLLFSCGNK